MSFLAALSVARDLAEVADRLAAASVHADREADVLRARWAANAEAYWRRRDLERKGP